MREFRPTEVICDDSRFSQGWCMASTILGDGSQVGSLHPPDGHGL